MNKNQTEPIMDAREAINFALDRLVPPLTDDFLQDWRAGNDLNRWLTMVAEAEEEAVTFND